MEQKLSNKKFAIIIGCMFIVFFAINGLMISILNRPKTEKEETDDRICRIDTIKESLIEICKYSDDGDEFWGSYGVTHAYSTGKTDNFKNLTKSGIATSFKITQTTAENMGLVVNDDIHDKAEYTIATDKSIYYDKEQKKLVLLTDEELRDKQKKGEICYSAKDSWDIIGKDTCVVFFPYHANTSKGIHFLSESKNYRESFEIVFKGDFISFNKMRKKYFGTGAIYADGKIERYEGHPEIVVWSKKNIGKAKVVGYSLKYGTNGMLFSK